MRTFSSVAEMPQFCASLSLCHPFAINMKSIGGFIAYLVFAIVFATIQPTAPLAADNQTAPIGSWRLLRTANPKGGPEAVSISHTADMTHSDVDLAGMMLKCGEHSTEIVIVALTPFPPRARPEVTISALGKEWRFAASIVPPGAELLLPLEATHLAAGLWQSAHELSVHVNSPEQSFAGVIPIDGLGAALATLTANCPLH